MMFHDLYIFTKSLSLIPKICRNKKYGIPGQDNHSAKYLGVKQREKATAKQVNST